MCTIITLFRVADVPLVVAANRDELLARAATGAEVLIETPRTIGGRDVASGGTWLGVGTRGFFVALTNQRTWTPPRSGARSRGEVVRAMLQAGDVRAATDVLGRVRPGAVAPFNVIFGDAAALRVGYARAGGVRVRALGPGVHVLANDELGSPAMPKTRPIQAAVAAMLARDARWSALRPQLATLLEDERPVDAACVPPPPPNAWIDHARVRALQRLNIDPALFGGSYGTRSANLFATGAEGVLEHLYCAGRPGTAPFRDVTPLHRGAV